MKYLLVFLMYMIHVLVIVPLVWTVYTAYKVWGFVWDFEFTQGYYNWKDFSQCFRPKAVKDFYVTLIEDLKL